MILPNKPTTQNRISLKEVAIICERFSVSDRADVAMAIVTAFGIITDSSKTYIID